MSSCPEHVRDGQTAPPENIVENIRVEAPDDWLRVTRPVYWDVSKNAWVLTRHSDIALVMRSSKLFVEAPFSSPGSGDEGTESLLATILGGWLVFKNAPQHTRLRDVLQAAFMSRPIAAMRPGIRAITNEILDKLGTRTAVELIEEFAVPIPATVISDLCGARREDAHKILNWAVFCAHPLAWHHTSH